MNILLIATPEKKDTIAGYVQSYQPFFQAQTSITFQLAEEKPAEPETFDRIILDEEGLDRAIVLLDSLKSFENVYLWLFDISGRFPTRLYGVPVSLMYLSIIGA